MLEKILKDIGFSDTAVRIYLRLLETGYSSARQLAEHLNLPRPTVYDNLKLLAKEGLITEKDEENKKLFTPDDPQILKQLVHTKMERMKSNEKELIGLLPSLGRKTKALEPKIRFYSGSEGIKKVLNGLLWYKDIETLTMWPISEMVDILGEEYLADLNKKRIHQHIGIRGIWPRGKTVNLKNYPFLGVGKGHLRDLRLAPKGMNWNMSYWLFEDKVAFISGKEESFGFVVQSNDFSNLIRAQFEVIWNLSETIKPQPQYTDKFLETIARS